MTVSLEPASRQRVGKRYARFFSDRWTELQNWLTAAQLVAYINLAIAFVNAADGLPDDDEELARIARLSIIEWRKLRARLLHHDHQIFVIEHGRWVDPDQQANLDMQRKASARGLRGAAATNAKRLTGVKLVQGGGHE